MSTAGVPNIPNPVNGMIKTYDASHRTFERPYSAKTVFFYKDGDDKFKGVRVPVSKSRYKSMEALLDDLNYRVPLDFGVRRVFTPHGKSIISDPSKLKHMGMYVCSSSKWASKVNATNLERLSRQRKSHNNSSGGNTTSNTPPYYNRNHRRVRSHNDSILVVFLLNRVEGKSYRTVLRRDRLPNMDALLSEISRELNAPIYKLFTLNSERVEKVGDLLEKPDQRYLACERHERPNNQNRFPPLPRRPPIPRPNRGSSTEGKSSVDSLPPLPPRGSKRYTRPSPNKTIKKERPFIEQSTAASKIQAGARGYLTRKKIKNKKPGRTRSESWGGGTSRKKGGGGRRRRRRSRSSSTSAVSLSDLLEGSEMEMAARRIQAVFRALMKWKRFKRTAGFKRKIGAIRSSVAHAAATTIQSSYRGYRDRKRVKLIRRAKKNVMMISPRRARRASTKIQAAFRGYRTRQFYSRPTELYDVDCWTPVPPAEIDFGAQEMAAVQIQAAYRGYRARKKLDSSS